MITREEGRQIAQAINGAIGIALEKLVKGDLDRPHQKMNGAQLAESAAIGKAAVRADGDPFGKLSTVDAEVFEVLYQKIKRRLIDECRVDPILLTLLTTAPIVDVKVEPREVSLNGASLKGRLMRLAVAGFFKTPKTQADTNRELGRTGALAHTGRLSEAFADLRNDGFLTLEGDGFQMAPGLTVTETIIEAR